MSELVADCPRCRSQRITFELTKENLVGKEYDWQRWYEVFCVCRHCRRSTVFVLSQKFIEDDGFLRKNGLVTITGAVNNRFNIESYISMKDASAVDPPEFLPKDIDAVFREGAKCLSVSCFNAAGTMFRLCVDIATREKLPQEEIHGLNAKIRRNLGLRLPWLFNNSLLPEALRDLSLCIKEDGNDGAHAGSLTNDDAEDLLDFTFALLERIYTEPERLRLAQERRNTRRGKSE